MYLILSRRNIHHEGDERSRTHPGHGYGAWIEEVPVTEFFEACNTELVDRVKQLTARNQHYTVYEVKPVSVNVETTVTLSS